MMFCFRRILQIWTTFIGFRDMNDFVNLVICKRDFTFTCRGEAQAIADLPQVNSQVNLLNETEQAFESK